MSNVTTIPAAEYLRMSTEDQQYSLSNQRQRIREYSDKNGLVVGQDLRRPRQERSDD